MFIVNYIYPSIFWVQIDSGIQISCSCQSKKKKFHHLIHIVVCYGHVDTTFSLTGFKGERGINCCIIYGINWE